jgi:glycosyltransferase involved in cell wall biosynthesis
MKTPLRAAWLVWGDEGGGVATAVMNNAATLQRLGHQVSLLSLGSGPLLEAARKRGWVVTQLGEGTERHQRYIRYGFSLKGVLGRVRMLLGLREELSKGLSRVDRPEVLLLPWPDFMLLAGPACKRLGIGLVLEMPNTPSPYPLALNQRAYALATRHWRVRMLANSEFSASHMRRIPGVEVVTPAVDAPRFDPVKVVSVTREQLGIPTHAVVLGHIARLDYGKGVDLLIEAVAALSVDAAGVHLLLVGGPLASGYGTKLQAQVSALGLAERVHWLDTVPNPECYWACCDIAISARRDAEPFGLSIVEAMLMQRPVLAHSLGQPGATVEEGRTGWLYHQPSASALAATLCRALAARARWPEMGRLARDEVLRRFASHTGGERYLELLRGQALLARRDLV